MGTYCDVRLDTIARYPATMGLLWVKVCDKETGIREESVA